MEPFCRVSRGHLSTGGGSSSSCSHADTLGLSSHMDRGEKTFLRLGLAWCFWLSGWQAGPVGWISGWQAGPVGWLSGWQAGPVGWISGWQAGPVGWLGPWGGQTPGSCPAMVPPGGCRVQDTRGLAGWTLFYFGCLLFCVKQKNFFLKICALNQALWKPPKAAKMVFKKGVRNRTWRHFLYLTP